MIIRALSAEELAIWVCSERVVSDKDYAFTKEGMAAWLNEERFVEKEEE